MMYTSKLAGQTKSKEIVIDDDEEYGGFDTNIGLGSLQQDEGFQQALMSTPIGRKTAVPTRAGYGQSRLGTGRIGTARIGTGMMTAGRPIGTAGRLIGTAGRPIGTAGRLQTAGRPMTALRAAGYSGSTTTSSAQGKQAAPLATPPQDSLEEKIKQMEIKIMNLVEESCSLRAPREPNLLSPRNAGNDENPDVAKSLTKAQEASTLERQLQRLQVQSGLLDSANVDLSFTVMFNLACSYMRAGLPGEALQSLHAPPPSGVPPPHAPTRRGLLAASAHLALGEHRRALKLYRMALDGTPASEKDLKLKIMHNIGLLLVRMGKFRDAVTNFQHMMHEGPDFTTGLHLILCLVSLGDINGAKAAFQALVHIDIDQDLDLNEEIHEKFFTGETENAADAVFLDVLHADRLSVWAASRRAYRGRCVLRSARAIMLHDPNGLEWCAEVLRISGRVGLAASLEGGAAARALRSGKSSAARATLRRLGNDSNAPPDAKAAAACNLAFLAFMEGDVSTATKLSEEACAARAGCPSALVVRALCEVRGGGGEGGGGGGWRTARDLLSAAIEADPTQRDAHYFYGLSSEKLGLRQEAGNSYTMAIRAAPGDACARVRQAALARTGQDTDAAVHWYHQVIADSPHDHGVLVEMARMYEEAGDLSMAQHCYLDADAIFPGVPEVAGWLGARARSAGDMPQALAYFRRAAQLSPTQVQWSLQEAACLRAMGRHKEALAAYTRLHDRHPDNIECLQMLVKLSGAAGLRDAERWAAELQRARRVHQTAAESPLTIGSGGSSRGSSSPGAKGSLMSAGRSIHRNSSQGDHHMIQPTAPPLSAQDSLRRMVTSSSGRKPSEDDQDLPLPPD